MNNKNEIKIEKEIYIWAINESQKDFNEIESKFRNIKAWISQEKFPTFNQLKEFSNFLNVPLGYMFLDKPPKSDIIKSEFRTIGNKMPHISKNLKDTLFRIGRKRDWLSEYRKSQGWKALNTGALIDLGNQDIETAGMIAKKFIDLDEFWYKSTSDSILAFNFLRGKLQRKGITVMQSGIVGNNNRRVLNLDEFRGFLLYDEVAPIIFLNNKDSVNGKIFTLIHEYIHFLLEEEDIYIVDGYSNQDNRHEKMINEITAEFLMPSSHIRKIWNDGNQTLDQINDLSKLFHVSIIALAIKLKNMNKIAQQLVNDVIYDNTASVNNKPTSSGGDYYRTAKSRLGDSFLETVIQGAESGDIDYTQAFRLLDDSPKIYDYFKEEYSKYGE